MDPIEQRILEILVPAIRQLTDDAYARGKEEARTEILQRLSLMSSPSATLERENKTTSKTSAVNTSFSRHVPGHCVFPDCGKPHKGPRYSFMCDEHMGLPRRDKTRYLREWKTSQAK